MALKVHLIIDEVLPANSTITIRPASGKVGKFWYAKAGTSPFNYYSLNFIGETGTKILVNGSAFEFGEAIFGESTNYQKFEIAIDYNNYITIVSTDAAPGTYSVYWVET
jgi:hypothetical protein